MRIVIKLGGHLISTNAAIIDLGYIEKLTSVLRKVKEKHEVIVVTGGGAVSRAYIDALRRTNVNEALCDLMGIRVSRTNALLLSFMLKDLAKAVENIEELLKTDLSRKIVVMGGLQPGQSTTTTAAVVAEALGADLLIIATNVDGIYTSDPRRDPAAKKIDEITIKKLKEIFWNTEIKAGTYPLIDYLTIRILERSKIPTVVLNGKPPTNIIKAINGEKIGTRIRVK